MDLNKELIFTYENTITLFEEIYEQVKNEHLDNDFKEWLRYNEILLERLQNLN